MGSEQKKESSKLYNAILQDDATEIKRIIATEEEDVNKKLRDRCEHLTPLQLAILSNRVAAFKALLTSKKININDEDVPLLHFAMERRRSEHVKILVEDERIDINQSSPLHSPLTWAVSMQHLEYFNALLQSKKAKEIDVNKIASGYTAWSWSLLSRNTYCMETLLSRYPKINVFSVPLGWSFNPENLKKKLENKPEALSNLEKALKPTELDEDKSTEVPVMVSAPSPSNNTTQEPRYPEDCNAPLSKSVLANNPQVNYKYLGGLFLAIATPILYITGGIGIPLGFIRKPEATYAAFEKLQLDGLVDQLANSTQAQIVAGVIGGILFLGLLVVSIALIKNNQSSPEEQTQPTNKL